MSRVFITIFFVSLSIVCFDFALTTAAKTNVEVQPNVSQKELTGTINNQLFLNRFVIATAEPDGDFKLLSFPSVLTERFQLQCVEPYFDVQGEDLQWALSWMISPKHPETQFVQVIAQPNGLYTILRLRRLCAETEVK